MKARFMMAVVMFLVMGMTANGQSKNEGTKPSKISPEKMDSLQCQRMTAELMLNDASAAKFVPMYTNYLSELRTIHGKMMPPRDCKKMEADQQTDAEVQKMIEERFSKEQKILNVQQKYYKEFKGILTVKQIAKIFATPFGMGHFAMMPPMDMQGRGFRGQGPVMNNNEWNHKDKKQKSDDASNLMN